MDDELSFRLEAHAKEDLATNQVNKIQLVGDLFENVRLRLIAGFFSKEKVLEAADKAFELYIRPLDIPVLDPDTEKVFDDLLKQGFMFAVNLAWEKYCLPRTPAPSME